MRRQLWVVRVVMDEKEIEKHSMTPLLECLRYAQVIQVHSERCFDIHAPCRDTPDSKKWAEMNAERMSSFGYNAVAAPRWESGEPTP